jgi:hypothetical protein
MNFTFQQKLTMAMGFVGAATSAFGALNPIMTSTEALIGTVIFGFASACLAVVATVTSSQGSQIKAVAAMPGVEKVLVNANANVTTAQIAVSGAADSEKVEAIPSAVSAVAQTAKGA